MAHAPRHPLTARPVAQAVYIVTLFEDGTAIGHCDSRGYLPAITQQAIELLSNPHPSDASPSGDMSDLDLLWAITCRMEALAQVGGSLEDYVKDAERRAAAEIGGAE